MVKRAVQLDPLVLRSQDGQRESKLTLVSKVMRIDVPPTPDPSLVVRDISTDDDLSPSTALFNLARKTRQ